jgi:transposase
MGRATSAFVAATNRWSAPMAKQNDLSRCLATLDQDTTLIAVVEMGQSSWLVAGLVPGLKRNPLKKLAADRDALLQLLLRWRNEAAKAGHAIIRIAVAYEAGRDGFWLARWLRAQSIEAYVIHPSSVPVPREHRRAKTDRLDTELLKRAFLGWLRGEPKHCSMAAIPTLEDEDARRPGRERQTLVGERTRILNRLKANLARLGIRGFRPNLARAQSQLEALRTPEGMAIPKNTLAEMRRDMDRLQFVKRQIKEIEKTRAERLAKEPTEQRDAMVRLLERVVGVGVETADMLAQEVFAREIRDRRALARYAGLTGAPDESGQRRRERGLAKAGNARVRRGMIELAWGHLVHQKGSPLTEWYWKRASDGRGGTRKTMIVALARKLLIMLWRLVTTGETPEGLRLRPAA